MKIDMILLNGTKEIMRQPLKIRRIQTNKRKGTVRIYSDTMSFKMAKRATITGIGFDIGLTVVKHTLSDSYVVDKSAFFNVAYEKSQPCLILE